VSNCNASKPQQFFIQYSSAVCRGALLQRFISEAQRQNALSFIPRARRQAAPESGAK
jgi:hypothetical protein